MRVLRKHPLLTFFPLAYLLPWAIWGTTIAQQHGKLTFHLPAPLAFWVGLQVAIYVSAALTGGRAAVRDVLTRIFSFRISPRWYAVTVVVALAQAVVPLALFVGLGGHHAGEVGRLAPTATLPAFLLVEFLLFLFTEEAAWRGFALPRLQTIFTPAKASLVLGLLWSGWHIPLFLTAGSFQANIPYAGFVLATVSTSVIISWLFNNSGGSVVLPALYHAVADCAIAYLAVMTSSRPLFWLNVAAQVALALFLLLTGRVPNRMLQTERLRFPNPRSEVGKAADSSRSPSAVEAANLRDTQAEHEDA
jgi:membrane protease YdiL (CAAX protease family)